MLRNIIGIVIAAGIAAIAVGYFMVHGIKLMSVSPAQPANVSQVTTVPSPNPHNGNTYYVKGDVNNTYVNVKGNQTNGISPSDLSSLMANADR